MARLEEELIMDGELERLHAALVTALRRTRPAPFDVPVTVAEIYQDLVPYRAVRTELGFEMNADYEHTLLRLLAGEGELARLDPPEARHELREELDSPNPNVGIFRKFAACDVWITETEDDVTHDASAEESRYGGGAASAPAGEWPPIQTASDDDHGAWHVEPLDPPPGAARYEHRAEPQAWPAESTARDEVASHTTRNAGAADSTTDAGRAAAREPVAESVGDHEEAEFELVPVQRRATARGAAAEEREGRCAFCDSALPDRRMLRFCPYCGADQSQRPCGSCGEPLEADWHFCVACGSAADGSA
jgi:hypothetical protein